MRFPEDTLAAINDFIEDMKRANAQRREDYRLLGELIAENQREKVDIFKNLDHTETGENRKRLRQLDPEWEGLKTTHYMAIRQHGAKYDAKLAKDAANLFEAWWDEGLALLPSNDSQFLDGDIINGWQSKAGIIRRELEVLADAPPGAPEDDRSDPEFWN